MSEGSNKILPELLYENGVYHLLYQNFSRESISKDLKDLYYNSLLDFLLCGSSANNGRHRVRAMSFNSDETSVIIDDKQVIQNPQGWCLF